MHRLSEIDGVENPDTVSVLQKGLAAVDYDIAFRVSDHVGTMALQKVGFQPKSRLAAARAAHHQYVFCFWHSPDSSGGCPSSAAPSGSESHCLQTPDLQTVRCLSAFPRERFVKYLF